MSALRLLLCIATVTGFASAIHAEEPPLFASSQKCLSCHNKLETSHGEDVSIGTFWQASMMANSARDPYWQASVRREVLEHPEAAALIEDTCATCHMPMARVLARLEGEKAGVFHLLSRVDELAELAMEGVACNLCHQIAPDHFGKPESFNGGFTISDALVDGKRPSFGPYAPSDKSVRAKTRITDSIPTESGHIQQSEMCATCHTLYTPTLDDSGAVIGSLPEQMPYLEWRHSEFGGSQSCQSCHMPVVDEAMRHGLGGEPREGLSRHQFRGGNAFMMKMLARNAEELRVTARPADLERAAEITTEHLGSSSARLSIEAAGLREGILRAEIEVTNLGGHKLPTAYPSRRAWLHIAIRDAAGRTVFESGALESDGSIAGNANDDDASMFEPHYRTITEASQVQIYEPILVEPDGAVTTALLRASRYAKDNRLLPRGFDKSRAVADIAVRGAADEDPDFTGGSDRILLEVPLDAGGPFTLEAELLYQPIAYRWAHNLGTESAPEIDRFLRMYSGMSSESATTLARATRSITTGED